ncbi:MAG: hypothetical protein Q9173_004625 [Seirophora scorigena]
MTFFKTLLAVKPLQKQCLAPRQVTPIPKPLLPTTLIKRILSLPASISLEALAKTGTSDTFEYREERGLLMLAEMTTKGSLATGAYTQTCIESARKHKDFVVGFVANKPLNGFETVSSPSDDEDFLVFTTGINRAANGDPLGQQYRTPKKAIAGGSDFIISGRGIYATDDPVETVAVAESPSSLLPAMKMLTRRLLLQSFPPNTVRAFSSSPSHHRVPSLADIQPNNAPTFDARQKEFRDKVKEAYHAREKQDSQSVTAPSSSTSSASAPGGAGRDGRPSSESSSASSSPASYAQASGNGSVMQALGSLATHTSEAARESTSEQESSTRKGALSSLIYGTREGQQMDQEIEKSFSQVLARGKYVHSIVFHSVKPKKVDEYVNLVGEWYPKMAKLEANHVNLVGSWRTEVGDCDTFVHIWEYQRYQGYHASLHSIASHPDFPAFDRKLKTLITHKQSSVMQEFSFWPTTPPRQLGGLFELRSYTLHPGNLLEWETHWRKGLKARREVMEGVGAWFVQIGDLNTVHHLWQFANLEERKARREMSWGVEGWGETVHKTVPLIQTMKSRVLVPMPWSPVA